jgi:hypothetical protein
MINVCPVGRSCSQAQRDEFAAYDKVRAKYNVDDTFMLESLFGRNIKSERL